MPGSHPAPVTACTISRDISQFDLLSRDMDRVMNGAWGDLTHDEALALFSAPDVSGVEFAVLTLDSADESNLPTLCDIVAKATAAGVPVILVTADVSPAVLHRLLRLSDGDFIPYPLPEGELRLVVTQIRTPYERRNSPAATKKEARDGAVLAVHGLAGGVGATTLAVNLAWELATSKTAPSVCIMDFDMQFGAVGTSLDFTSREVVFELLSDIENMDADMFRQALSVFKEQMHVLTAPAEMLPLDMLTPRDIQRLIDAARAQFDYVVIDMPSALVNWTETVLHAAHVYFSVIGMDMRSAQNALRFKRALQAEDLPVEKLRHVLNRAPGFMDLSGKGRVKRLAEGLDVSLDVLLSDGARAVVEAGDHGLPLALAAARNPLRKDIAKLAASVVEVQGSASEAA